jgi:hypothetical protein
VDDEKHNTVAVFEKAVTCTVAMKNCNHSYMGRKILKNPFFFILYLSMEIETSIA